MIKVIEILKDPKKLCFLFGAGLVILCMLWFNSCQDAKQAKEQAKLQKEISDQNIRALNDTMVLVKNKAGEVEASKSSFISKLDDLAKLNQDLYNESKKEIGSLKAIIQSNLTINNPLEVSNQLQNYGSDNYGLDFEKSENTDSLSYSVKGVSKFSIKNNVVIPGVTDILENKINAKIVLGFKENENDYTVFARSPSKLLKIDDLSGSLIIPKKGGDIIPTVPAKKKKFGLGPYVGYGLTPDLKLHPSIGVSFSYNIIQF